MIPLKEGREDVEGRWKDKELLISQRPSNLLKSPYLSLSLFDRSVVSSVVSSFCSSTGEKQILHRRSCCFNN